MQKTLIINPSKRSRHIQREWACVLGAIHLRRVNISAHPEGHGEIHGTKQGGDSNRQIQFTISNER